ncbi:DUF2442 domain-containing protein [Methylomonas sp. SURF-2]|uniref:DUF2442 domain-containing protein n=1 Tax=Methylomonas subterranea TaxID=2952225 RepID=A0ABT1TDD4_9GAMM|nr:DUF2442 domain-containing protein [Methylomonas sp. SURF-2]MCQ8103461.1 DUF2442 domain-containing protein [Methylomonas sp. SURF-2]
MKLKQIEHIEAYRFILTFENGEIIQADLKGLIGSFIAEDALQTARIDPDWGCLEFNQGAADIEPKTLYRFVCEACQQEAA